MARMEKREKNEQCLINERHRFVNKHSQSGRQQSSANVISL